MPRRRKKADSLPIDTTTSTPEVSVAKKQRKRDEDLILESILSNNRYSTGGTAINDSDVGDFGEDPNEQQPQQLQRVISTKIPPLMVKLVSLAKLQAMMKTIDIKAVYKLCRIGIKVVISSKEDYLKAKSLLSKKKVEFFTFDMPSEKPFKAVIRGLPVMDTDEVKEDLERRYKLHPLAVFPMSRHDKQKEYRDCLYLVHFKKGTVTLGGLKAAKVILDIIISWEAYRGANRDVTQCMRCLHFGHGARNCGVKPRCSVCTQQHETKECPIEEVAEVKCANCGGGHRATDRSCAKREEYKRIRSQAASRNQPRRRPNGAPCFNMENFPSISPNSAQSIDRLPAPSAPPPGLSYRDQLRQDPTAQQSKTWHRNRSQPTDGDDHLLTPEQLLPIFREMWSQLQQCHTRADQILCLGEFIIRHG